MEAHDKFTLPPEVQAELGTLPEPTAPGYLDSLQRASFEVVVLARRLATGQILRDQIDSILVSRLTPVIRAAVQRHGRVSRTEFKDAEQEAMVLFWEAIQSESFFEVRFNQAMQFLAKQAGRKIRGGKQREFERSSLRAGTEDSEDPDGRDSPIDVPDDVDEYSRSEDRDLIDVGLASLTEEQARAIILHYRMELQIYSHDPAARTVASVLGCGERKARKLIADGRAGLRRAIGQEDDDESR